MEKSNINSPSKGRYDINKKLGEGVYTEVYVATDKKLVKQVAIKLLKKQYKQDAAVRRRFLASAYVMTRIHHPHVLTIYLINEKTPYIVLPLVESGDLSAYIEQRKGQNPPLRTVELLSFLHVVTHALATAHHDGCIHGNLSPQNILMVGGFIPVLSDFMFEKKTAGIFRKGIVGKDTVPYLSPEQLTENFITPHTDQYSVALITYYMLTAQAPPANHALVKHFFTPQRFADCPSSVAQHIVTFLHRCLQTDGFNRYPDMTALWQAVSDIRNTLFDELKRAPERAQAIPAVITKKTPGEPEPVPEQVANTQIQPPTVVETTQFVPPPPTQEQTTPPPISVRPSPPPKLQPPPPTEAIKDSSKTDTIGRLISKAKQLLRERQYRKALGILQNVESGGVQNPTLKKLIREAQVRVKYQEKVQLLINQSLLELKDGHPDRAEQKLISALHLDQKNARVLALLEKVKSIKAQNLTFPE